jgi:hypothetical protein
VRWNHAHGRVTDRRGKHFHGPGHETATLAYREQPADKRTHHVVTERVRDHEANGHPIRIPLPLQPPQRPHSRRSLPPTAKSSKVMLPKQQ